MSTYWINSKRPSLSCRPLPSAGLGTMTPSSTGHMALFSSSHSQIVFASGLCLIGIILGPGNAASQIIERISFGSCGKSVKLRSSAGTTEDMVKFGAHRGRVGLFHWFASKRRGSQGVDASRNASQAATILAWKLKPLAPHDAFLFMFRPREQLFSQSRQYENGVENEVENEVDNDVL
ncbi:hypothetical protein BDZ45DRAFT_688599 [Acephala macrosclerotiorum]|nr:hypothetical protein BDZ45DRAFT_688599 [Acephala macrosclerotiorum]